MDKFGRNYALRVESTTPGVFIDITLDVSIEFDITRNTLSSANVCQVRLYNLNEAKRNQIYFNVSDQGNYRSIELKAGYGDSLATIFKGNISQAWSVREGVNFITQIECYDGGFAFINGEINLPPPLGTSLPPFPAGTPNDTVIRTLMGRLPNVTVGKVGDYSGSLSRGNSYSGNPARILTEITGNGFFVDGETANALKTDEYIVDQGGVTLINAQTGLLGTPILEQTILRFDMIFEPKLNIGHLVLINSLTSPRFNGNYKITAIKHRGMISSSVAGSVITTGEFFYSKILTPVF